MKVSSPTALLYAVAGVSALLLGKRSGCYSFTASPGGTRTRSYAAAGGRGIRTTKTTLRSTQQEDKTSAEEAKSQQEKGGDAVNGAPAPSLDGSGGGGGYEEGQQPQGDGLPFWWELIWDLDMMKLGVPGEDIVFGDTANVLRTNIEQIYGGYPSIDGCPLAEGEITDIAEGTMFIGLQRYNQRYGSPYKLCFGPKSFLVISDPVQAKHVLREQYTKYDKGMLGELLDPIMGKGLIPADPATWGVRRKQIVPAFHKAWLDHMVGLFGYCNEPLIERLNEASDKDGKAEMETYFNSVAVSRHSV